jgi:NADPH2 dehydrogenase
VFGRLFISNPDLVYQIEKGIQLTAYVRSRFYELESQLGYTDWPFSKDCEAAELEIATSA